MSVLSSRATLRLTLEFDLSANKAKTVWKDQGLHQLTVQLGGGARFRD